VITRASKVLVHSDWSGTDYKLLVQSQDQLERRLDELAIDSVIVDTARATDPPPHQALLEEAVWTSPAWKRGEQTGHLVLYRRIRSPAFPRRPRQVDLLDKIGTVIQEP
jgi:hypothetical protein